MLFALLSGCAATETEKQFGNAVRDTLAQQRIQPQPADDEPVTGDGPRTENVIHVYRSNMGDPGGVVGARKVTKE
jgi:hypothetical protein